MAEYINFNGNLLMANQPVFKSSSRAARFGDGVFETMRMQKGKILFADRHSSRLFHGLELLRFKLSSQFDWNFLLNEINRIVNKNNCSQSARIRLMISRGDGGILEEPANSPQFLIECWPLEKYLFNQEGLSVDIFEDARKSIDKYSNLKTSNYLPSVMATVFAKENGLDECLLLNSQGRICEGTISNIFWIKDQHVFTPPLTEGGFIS